MRYSCRLWLALTMLSLLALLMTGCSEDDPSSPETGGSINIDVEPAGILAPWELSGPNGYDRTGTGATSIDGLDSGEYEINWLDSDQWHALDPDVESGTLENDGVLEFTGIYQAISGPSTIVLDFEDQSLSDWVKVDSDTGDIGAMEIVAGQLSGEGEYVLQTSVDDNGTVENDKSSAYYLPSTDWSIQSIEYDYKLVYSTYNKMYLRVGVDGPENTYSSGYFVSLDPTNAVVTMRSHASYPPPLLAQVPRSFQAGQVYHLRMELDNESVQIYIDDDLVIDVEDSSFRSGGFALGVGNAGGDNGRTTQFDNVVVVH